MSWKAAQSLMRHENTPASLRLIGEGRILGIDYGRKRIGLALSDPMQMVASTLKTVTNRSKIDKVAGYIANTAREQDVVAIVVGLPLHMTGELSDMAIEVNGFIDFLESEISTPIFMWDERWTTTSAEKLYIETGRSPSRSRDKIDQVAAAYLLQNFLDRLSSLKNTATHEKS